MKEQSIATTYNANEWENELYDLWEKSGFFNPDVCITAHITDATKPAFSIVLPPPNVTGTLHAGHASMLAIEDTIVRYHRMKGDRTLWLPGTDHASIATQSRVEKNLIKDEGKTRHDFGREEFLKRVEQFAQNSHDTIINQCKKMGSSLDWSREAYTLDEKRSLAVRTAFKRMYDDGIIHQGFRPINWSTKGQSTCSDDELVYVDRKAKLYTFKYSKDFPIAIATTRPETKLADTAVAVNPDDRRYQEFIGKTFEIESFANGPHLSIKIIADRMVDASFGTGAVGITPAHSHTDYDFFLRHRDEISFMPLSTSSEAGIIDTDGKMNGVAGKKYQGLTILEAREKVITTLKASNLLENEEDIEQSIGTSDRYEDIIEVLPLKQWFIDVDKEFTRKGRITSLKQLMRESVTSGKITILPDRFAKTYLQWIDNLRPWCISRQIWFGHRIPVWYRNEEIYCGINAPTDKGWEQDTDTLDTWFSSGLWTFSTLGWPDTEAPDFKNFHPTNLLETGYDILPFWVARMILMTEYLLDTHPFDTVYLHGLVRDEQGQKMSKSLGNVMDPLIISEKYGADALRMALISGSTPGNDIKLSDEKIVAMRNFTNKLWNLARYVGMVTKDDDKTHKDLSDADRSITQRLRFVTKSITAHLEHYELSLATEELRDFTWNEFADWYVEIHKVEKNDRLLRSTFSDILKLWHPFMPFVTEAIHQTFHFDTHNILMIASWPTFPDQNENTEDKEIFEQIKNLIITLRNTRAVYHIEPAKKITISTNSTSENILHRNEAMFKRLARIEDIKNDGEYNQNNAILVQSGSLQVFLHIDGLIDITKERDRFEKEKTEKEKYQSSLKVKLENKNFIERAKPEIILTEQEKLRLVEKEIEEINHHLSSLHIL